VSTARAHLDEGVALTREIGDLANLAYLLEALAVLEHPPTTADAERTALLLGAAQSLRETVGSNVYSYYQPDTARTQEVMAQARALLGEQAYAGRARPRARPVGGGGDGGRLTGRTSAVRALCVVLAPSTTSLAP
jgi:hypothetical protein